MKLSENIGRIAEVDAHSGVVFLARNRLFRWQEDVQDLERRADRNGLLAYILGSVAVGLLLALLYVASFPAVTPVVKQPGREVMQLSPTEIRASRQPVYEL